MRNEGSKIYMVGIEGLKFIIKDEGSEIFVRNEGSEIYARKNEGSENSTQEIEGSEKLGHFSREHSGRLFPFKNVRPLSLAFDPKS